VLELVVQGTTLKMTGRLGGFFIINPIYFLYYIYYI